MKSIVFLIRCSDQKGLVSHISSFFYQKNFNIVHCEQHTDTETHEYFMRIKLDLNDLTMPRKELEDDFSKLAEKFNLHWSVHYSDIKQKLAIFATRAPHCLYDLLIRQKENELYCDIPLIISNRPDLEFIADQFKIPFYCYPVEKDKKAEQEEKVLDLLKKHHIDNIVLARYMQILSSDFVSNYENRIINIHHAFLPAFQGAKPYHQAFMKGVKLIGATAHYVTSQLDEGPIIEQNVERVNHRYNPEGLTHIGSDIERLVLFKAVKAHLENRIIVTGNRTIVFSDGA